jgi:hypothetical protein
MLGTFATGYGLGLVISLLLKFSDIQDVYSAYLLQTYVSLELIRQQISMPTGLVDTSPVLLAN